METGVAGERQDDKQGIWKYGRGYLIKVGIVLVCLVAAIYAVYQLSSIFTPLFVALALAYVLNPLVNWLEKRGVPRQRGVILIFAMAATLLTLAFFIVVPILVSDIETATEAVMGETANPVVPLDNMTPADGVPQRIARGHAAQMQSLAVFAGPMGGMAAPAVEAARPYFNEWLVPPADARRRLPEGLYLDLAAEAITQSKAWAPEEAGSLNLKPNGDPAEPANMIYAEEDLRPWFSPDPPLPGYFRDSNFNLQYDPGEEANRRVPVAKMVFADGIIDDYLRQRMLETQLAVQQAGGLGGLAGVPLAALRGPRSDTDVDDAGGEIYKRGLFYQWDQVIYPALEVQLPGGTFIDNRMMPKRPASDVGSWEKLIGYVWGSYDPKLEPGNRMYADSAMQPLLGEWEEGQSLPPGRYIDANGNGTYEPGYIAKLRRSAEDPNTWLGRFMGRLGYALDDRGLEDRTFDWISKHAETILARVPATLSAGFTTVNFAFSFIINLTLVPFYMYFFMLGLRDIRDTVYRYIPRDYRDRTIDVLERIHHVIAAFFRQRLIICLIMGAVTALGFLIVGVRFGLLLGLLIGLMSIVPFISLIPMIPITFMVWADYGSLWYVGGVWLVYGVGQSLDGILTPLMMGRDVELHPVTLVVCLFIGAEVMGVLGMLLAIPVTAALKIVATEILLPIMREVAEPTPATRERITQILVRGPAGEQVGLDPSISGRTKRAADDESPQPVAAGDETNDG